MEYLTALFGIMTFFGVCFYFWLGTKSGHKWMVGDDTTKPTK